MPQFDFLNEVSGSYDHAKDKIKGLGAEFSMHEAESDSERSAAVSTIKSEGAIHSYPINLDSAVIDKPQECIRFTAVKQGGLSLEGDEYERLMIACKKSQPFWCPIIDFAIQVGMRRGELLKAEWSMVDMKKKIIFQVADAQHNYAISDRSIIHLEYCIFSLINLLHNN